MRALATALRAQLHEPDPRPHLNNCSHVLETVATAQAWQEEVRRLYHTGTPPIRPESVPVQFETLVNYLNDSEPLLKAALENVSIEWLEAIHSNYRGEKTHYAHMNGFQWHETFQIGQLEILRAFIESKRV